VTLADIVSGRSEYSDQRLRVQLHDQMECKLKLPQHAILVAMLAKILGQIWRRLPAVVRLRAAKLGQRRFTVTVAAILFDDAQRILLLEHVFRADRGWGVPGGFIAKGEQPEEALRRELREEVSIDLDDIRLIFTRTLARIKQIEIYYRARVVGEPKPSSFEIKAARWFPLSDLPAELSQDQRRLIERALALDEKCN
jgi:ADP-ribose pyrophosphatase YjhB (NUDIX family)